MTITQEYLKRILDYDADTGVLTWRHRPDAPKWLNSSYAGKTAGCKDNNGYLTIGIDRKIYKAHRLAWLWMTGSFPELFIDHIDMDPANNSWGNLRLADASQNKMNMRALRTNKCGLKGVHRRGSRWIAQIQNRNRHEVLGSFETPEAAHLAYVSAAARLHREFARVA